MTITRRDFSLGLAGVAGLGHNAFAQAGPVEGKDYKTVSPPAPVVGGGKVDVVEFFWYGCPHCNALEPMLEAWVAKLPPDVQFRRVPAGFTPMHEYHLRLYYALEAMGQLPAYHRKVFAAIHVGHQRLQQDADVTAWANSVGLDGAKLVQTMKSFSVAGKLTQAKTLAGAYHLDGVPTIGVQGRYVTSASMVGSEAGLFKVVDALIAVARKQVG